MAIFDAYMMVDWSARGAPSALKPEKDAIYIAYAEGPLAPKTEYFRTRALARAYITKRIDEARSRQMRLLCGFDFPLGYPTGFAEKITGDGDVLALWEWLFDHIEDNDQNENNRFEVARDLNAHFDGLGPFWGCPQSIQFDGLPHKGREVHGKDHPPARRIVETHATTAQPVWKLYTTGAVGSQALLGIPMLEGLRQRFKEIRVWPFEDLKDANIVFAEIYPSLFKKEVEARSSHAPQHAKDRHQVEAALAHFQEIDHADGLKDMLDLTDFEAQKTAITKEEGWILGVPTRPALPFYIRDPKTIYQNSFDTIRREADLTGFPKEVAEIAIRVIHACGMVEIAGDLAYSQNLVEAGRRALQAGAPVFCDCEAVRSSIIKRYLPRDNDVICTINDAEVPQIAHEIGNTRSAAATHLWDKNLEGSIVVIGNAPTALFHLLERIKAKDCARPAAILGFPVGFVGASESKAWLAEEAHHCEFITLLGRKGGSALAAAAFNALCAGLREEK